MSGYFLNDEYEPNYKISKENIYECIKEIEGLRCNRKEFLNSKIEERLDKCNEVFMNEFNTQVNNIIDMVERDNYSGVQYSRFMKKINRSILSSQNSLIHILKDLSSEGGKK